VDNILLATQANLLYDYISLTGGKLPLAKDKLIML
jgi:hypothetical protein